MATLARLHNFVPNTLSVSANVDAEFNNILSFLNNSLSHVDGSKAFTARPLLPASDPTGDDQAARKRYVDDRVLPSKAVRFNLTGNSTRAANASFTNWPDGNPDGALTLAITKKRADTKLIVTAGITGFVSLASPVPLAQIGVRLASTDYVMDRFLFNTANEHQTIAGSREFVGLGSGSHTFTLRVKCDVQTLNGDNQDQAFIMVEEAF